MWPCNLRNTHFESAMKHVVRLFCITVVTATVFPSAVTANDERDLRTLDVPNVVRICESQELLQLLNLSESQTENLNDALASWKSEYFAALREIESPVEGKGRRRPIASGREDNGLGNAISNLLDDEQHQLFRQMLTLWIQSPVQSRQAFQFDLRLSGQQHKQLHELEIRWILQALRDVPCIYRFQRHTETRDRSQWGKRLEYSHAIVRSAWEFVPARNAAWNSILTPAQARRWKERELQAALGTYGFEILLIDFTSSRVAGKTLSTGTWLDYTVPYYASPFDELKWSDQQLAQFRELDGLVRAETAEMPSDRAERIKWFQKQRDREQECWRQIEALMTAEQRATWWSLIGEPAESFVRELKSRSVTTKADDAKNDPGEEKP